METIGSTAVAVGGKVAAIKRVTTRLHSWMKHGHEDLRFELPIE